MYLCCFYWHPGSRLKIAETAAFHQIVHDVTVTVRCMCKPALGGSATQLQEVHAGPLRGGQRDVRC